MSFDQCLCLKELLDTATEVPWGQDPTLESVPASSQLGEHVDPFGPDFDTEKFAKVASAHGGMKRMVKKGPPPVTPTKRRLFSDPESETKTLIGMGKEDGTVKEVGKEIENSSADKSKKVGKVKKSKVKKNKVKKFKGRSLKGGECAVESTAKTNQQEISTGTEGSDESKGKEAVEVDKAETVAGKDTEPSKRAKYWSSSMGRLSVTLGSHKSELCCYPVDGKRVWIATLTEVHTPFHRNLIALGAEMACTTKISMTELKEIIYIKLKLLQEKADAA